MKKAILILAFALASMFVLTSMASAYHYGSYNRPYYTSDVISVNHYSYQTAYYGRNTVFYTTPVQRHYDVRTYRLYYPEYRYQRYNFYW